MQFSRLELPAGDGQLIVLFVNQDNATMIDAGVLAGEVAADAAERLKEGWRLSSVASIPMRQMGTAGNFLFQSGGQYATQVALIAVFSRQSA